MAESSGSPTASRDVMGVTAPLLFGRLFNWVLYGVLCVQMCSLRPDLYGACSLRPQLIPTYPPSDVYSDNFPKDPRSVKFLAYFDFVLETAQTALTGADIYYWLVAGFGDVERLRKSRFGPIDVPIMTAITSLIVQGYFCYRIWILMSRRLSSWICWIIAVAAVTQAVAATWLGIASLMVEKYAVSRTAVYLWSISSAIADILIAVAMTLLLRRASGKFSSFVLIRVIRLTVETNTLTGTYFSEQATPTISNTTHTRLLSVDKCVRYSNTLLVSLNNRIYFREHQPPEHGDSTSLTVSDGVRATALSSLRFAVTEPQSRTPTSDNFQLYTIAQIVNKGIGDDTSTN
ncbi:hypothetical protein EDB89DRAFT_2243421 [Lactarius sanguifluus]|nr:hypothetical protein EDB89DRAFT_2243421 [Lactarius sanguifluus]